LLPWVFSQSFQHSANALAAEAAGLGAVLTQLLGVPAANADDDAHRRAPEPRLAFFVLEAACILIFTVEYLARVLTIG
jgi:hypothetical protein